MQAIGDVDRLAEERWNFSREPPVAIRRGPIGLELTFAVVDQACISEKLEAARTHLQLNRKIEHAIQPWLNDKLTTVMNGPFYPTELLRQQIRFPKANGIVTGQAMNLFDN